MSGIPLSEIEKTVASIEVATIGYLLNYFTLVFFTAPLIGDLSIGRVNPISGLALAANVWN